MIKLIWICQNDLRPLPKKVMEKKNIKGRITFVTACLAPCDPKGIHQRFCKFCVTNLIKNKKTTLGDGFKMEQGRYGLTPPISQLW